MLIMRAYSLLSLLALLPLTCASSSFGQGTATTAPREVVIAVVGSSASSETEAWARQLRTEMGAIAGSRYTPSFIEVASKGTWNADRARQGLLSALADPKAEMVLLVDRLSISIAAQADLPLAKPVLGGLLADPGLCTMPYSSEGVSTKENFHVHAVLQKGAELLRTMREALPFQSVRILLNEAELQQGKTWGEKLRTELGLPVKVLPLPARVEDCQGLLEGDQSPILLMPSQHYSTEERARLFADLVRMKIPAFSLEGERDALAGALAGGMPEERERLARSVALRMDRLVSGQEHISLGHVLSVHSRLFVNERVARETGVGIDFRLFSKATFVDRVDASGPVLSLKNALLGALEENKGLKGRQASSEEARETMRMAKGLLGPRVAAAFRHQQVDRDRAEFAGVVLPETVVRGGIAFEQTLIDTEVWAKARAAREAYLAATHQEQAERLELIEKVCLSYLQELSARALVRIAEENLAATGQNLELARLRQRTGSAGPEEILRFESAEAQQRGELARARARMAQARVDLARLCSLNPETAWKTEDLGLDHPDFSFSAKKVIERLRSEDDIRRFLSWASSHALAHSPDLAVLEQLHKAQSIDVAQKSQRRYIPKVGIGASYDRVLDMELGGPTLIEQLARKGVLPPPSRIPDKNEWGVALTASLPVFSSGVLSAEKRKSRAELRRIEYGQAEAREAIVARARAAFHALEGSYPSIELASISAVSATKNLEISQQRYEQGTISIVALLDAQTNAFAAKQASELAVYRFLADLVCFQRAIGWYELLSTQEEQEALFKDIDQLLTRP